MTQQLGGTMKRIIVGLMIISVAGCGGNAPTAPSSPAASASASPTGQLFRGQVAAAATSNSQMSAVAAGVDGSILGVLGPLAAPTGAVFRSRDGASLTVLLRPDGRPDRAVVGDTILIFENYTATTVDVAILPPNGASAITRSVTIAVHSSPLLANSGSSPSDANSAKALVAALKLAASTVDLVSCGIGLAAGLAGAPFTGLTSLLLVAACSSMVVTIVRIVADTEADALENSGGQMATAANTLTCLAGNKADCVSAVLSTAASVAEALLLQKKAVTDELKRRMQTFDVAGRWAGTVTISGCGSGTVTDVVVNVAQTGSRITGTSRETRRTYCGAPIIAPSITCSLSGGTIEGREVAFATSWMCTRDDTGQPLVPAGANYFGGAYFGTLDSTLNRIVGTYAVYVRQ